MIVNTDLNRKLCYDFIEQWLITEQRGAILPPEIINHFFDVYIQNLKTLIAEIEEA